MDLCLEQTSSSGEPPSFFTARQIADKVLELYWPHTAPFQGRGNWQGILRQATGGDAEILSAIQRFRERAAADPSECLSRARHGAPERYNKLVGTIEWKLIEMPLPRVQVIGTSESRFLYDIGLERPVVVLIDIDSYVERGDAEVLYVGLTRGRLHLVVVGKRETIAAM